jgi:hypothetical protein
VALLQATWASGSSASNALLLRGALVEHLIACEQEPDGRALVDGFLIKMEAWAVVAGRGQPGSQTLARYLRAQLRLLRRILDRHFQA